ncbi:hypothetical protein Bca4012_088538 [Brassica carinata]
MTIRVLAIGEGRGSESGDRDATMMDVGERARPPGDPPDAAASYASKVVGTNGGGMPVLESLIDDVFVSERLRVEFPNGEDGEPSITIEPEVLEAMNGMWRRMVLLRERDSNLWREGKYKKGFENGEQGEMGWKKVVEGARGRPKNLNNKPARGLVLGPTKGEVSLSESGKRVRVEILEAGRAGGAFRESVAEPRVTVKPLQLRDEELENPMDSTISEMEQR